jgi:hypothetical protein
MIIKDGISSFQMHAFRIGKPCFQASMQNDFSLFIQIKLNFGVTSWCFFLFLFFFWFFRCMVTFLRNHLNFQYSLVLNKHQNDFYFCTKLWIPENSLEEKGNTPKDSWCSDFVSKYCAQSVIYMKQQQKMKTCHEHRKTLDLINMKALLTKKILLHCEPSYQQDWNKLKQTWSRK